MRIERLLAVIMVFAMVAVLCGCVPQEKFDDIKAQNRIQQERLTSLESQLNASELQLRQYKKQNETLRSQAGANFSSKDADIVALEKDIAAKKELIAKMRAQLLRGGVPLPMELSVQLQDFASDSDMITFDDATGVLKFKSDLLFSPGSDMVASGAIDPLKALCNIIKSESAAQFDVVIVGHTDDVRISKAATKAKHPTNWHLSVHRAISVLNLMTDNGIASDRVSVKGYGEFKPVEPNKSGKKGNSANRRVEIFIVPAAS